jgi:hypothetical protein
VGRFDERSRAGPKDAFSWRDTLPIEQTKRLLGGPPDRSPQAGEGNRSGPAAEIRGRAAEEGEEAMVKLSRVGAA